MINNREGFLFGLYYQEREDSNSDYPYQKGVNFPCSTFLIDLI